MKRRVGDLRVLSDKLNKTEAKKLTYLKIVGVSDCHICDSTIENGNGKENRHKLNDGKNSKTFGLLGGENGAT